MNCSCHCNGKCKMLGGLEQKIMEILWLSSTPLKPQEVLSKLEGDYAYTTVMTVLKRMADKDLLTRIPSGKAFAYSPITDKDTFACQALNDLFERLFSSYGTAVVTAFKKSAQKHALQL